MISRRLVMSVMFLLCVTGSVLFSSGYKNVDSRSLKVPNSKMQTLEDCTKYIVKKNYKDIEKARAIYTWIANNISYNFVGLKSGNRGDNSATGTFAAKTAICEGYARLYEKMANLAGLENRYVVGKSKGYGYITGQKFDDDDPGHAWNVVKVDGQWILVDCTWGAGYIKDDREFVFKFNDYYFNTPPRQMILSHFPDDPEWQLLDQPIAMKEFLKTRRMTNEFFAYELVLLDHYEENITTSEHLVINLNAPGNIVLLSNIYKNGSEIRYGSIAQRNGDNYEIHSVFTEPGSYELKVFAKEETMKGSYPEVLSYKVKARYSGGEKKISVAMTFREFIINQCSIVEPIINDLKGGETRTFTYHVPNGKEGFLVMNDEWIPMDKLEGQMFSKTLEIEEGIIGVFVSFPKKPKYWKIVEYNVY